MRKERTVAQTTQSNAPRMGAATMCAVQKKGSRDASIFLTARRRLKAVPGTLHFLLAWLRRTKL